MPLASLDDINVHLPTDKLEVLDALDELMQIDAERVIRGYLSGVFSPTTLAGWSDPDISDPEVSGYVPELIRAIAGRFIAAFEYKRRYSEDIADVPEYAQNKYDEAMAMLRDIKSGQIVLEDVEEVVDTGTRFTREDFWPNDDAVPAAFTMEMEL